MRRDVLSEFPWIHSYKIDFNKPYRFFYIFSFSGLLTRNLRLSVSLYIWERRKFNRPHSIIWKPLETLHPFRIYPDHTVRQFVHTSCTQVNRSTLRNLLYRRALVLCCSRMVTRRGNLLYAQSRCTE